VEVFVSHLPKMAEVNVFWQAVWRGVNGFAFHS
jgi:hypothetical protein